jgi:SAM-dependent methyltransferase
VPLAEEGGYIHGLDLSEAMVAVCRRKLAATGIAPTKARAEVQDITNFALQQTFDLITAPYRVLQNLETEAAVSGLFRCIRQHLTPGGSCILNVFRPEGDPETLRREWRTEQERLEWEVAVEGGRVTCHGRRPRMNPDKEEGTLILQILFTLGRRIPNQHRGLAWRRWVHSRMFTVGDRAPRGLVRGSRGLTGS